MSILLGRYPSLVTALRLSAETYMLDEHPVKGYTMYGFTLTLA